MIFKVTIGPQSLLTSAPGVRNSAQDFQCERFDSVSAVSVPELETDSYRFRPNLESHVVFVFYVGDKHGNIELVTS